MTTRKETVHGFTAGQLASMFKFGFDETHPFFAEVSAMIDEFLDREYQATIGKVRRRKLAERKYAGTGKD